MTVKIFDTPEVQEFLKSVAGFDQEGVPIAVSTSAKERHLSVALRHMSQSEWLTSTVLLYCLLPTTAQRQFHTAKLRQPLHPAIKRISRPGIAALIIENRVAMVGPQRQSRATLPLAPPLLVE